MTVVDSGCGSGRYTIRFSRIVDTPLRNQPALSPVSGNFEVEEFLSYRRKPVTETVAPRIEEILEEWKTRTTPKQRVTGTRVHRQLMEEGKWVGITTEREYLREKKRKQYGGIHSSGLPSRGLRSG